jgi:hypothetical protein
VRQPEQWFRAISIRQPWAWAVIYGSKDVENRGPNALRQFGAAVGRRVYVHASKSMTPEEYEQARTFMAGLTVACPPPADLALGGVIGTVLVVDIVRTHGSPWFEGPLALVLADPRPEPFMAVRGQVGLFRVQLRQARP